MSIANGRSARCGSSRTVRDAEKAALALRAKINVNSGFRSPETVSELLTHYKEYELAEGSGKRSSTREVYGGFLKMHIEPVWGSYRLDQIRTVIVERWLRSLPLAPGTKTKIRNIMSAVFNHAKRHGMVAINPIQGVRCSSKRLKEPDVLTPEEFRALLPELPHRERVMVLLAGTTGLRRSELIALRWRDVDFVSLQLHVNKSCVRGQLGETKTRASGRSVPIHPAIVGMR